MSSCEAGPVDGFACAPETTWRSQWWAGYPTLFAKHKSIAKNLDAQFFFAHPYALWEWELNENTNGLTR